MLDFSDVTKRYDQTHALRSIDLRIDAGETVVLIGPSGCGKSTLLRLIVGLIRADSGRIRFEGQTLAPDNLSAARQRMGYVIQEGGLFPHLSVEGNVCLMARHLRRDPAWIASRLGELAKLVKLPVALMDRYP
ncbi:MAG: ATP-binding cassette domain-containing protein, partial [Gammaproteobacteria bacterium]